MFDYAFSFYNDYTIIFYFLLFIAVIVEGPITILLFSLVAKKLWVNFFTIFIFAFLWEFIWDLLHYIVWRFFSIDIFKNKKIKVLEKINTQLDKHSLLDKLIVIKYTPPITSIWLIYMWFKKIKLKQFLKYVSIFAIFNGLLITSIWYNLWYLFKDTENFWYFIILLFISLLIFYFLIKNISKFIIKKIYEQNS